VRSGSDTLVARAWMRCAALRGRAGPVDARRPHDGAEELGRNAPLSGLHFPRSRSRNLALGD